MDDEKLKKSTVPPSPKECELKAKIVDEIVERVKLGRAVTYLCGRAITPEGFDIKVIRRRRENG